LFIQRVMTVFGRKIDSSKIMGLETRNRPGANNNTKTAYA